MSRRRQLRTCGRLSKLSKRRKARAQEYEQELGYFNTVQKENKQLKVSAHNLQQKVNYLARVQQDNEELKRQVQESAKNVSLCTTLQRENGELKSRLLKLQPTSIISDAQINEKYIALCDDIEDWIDTDLGDTGDVVKRAMSAGDNDAYWRRFSQYMDSGLWKMLQENPGAQSSFFLCMVHQLILHRLVDPYTSGMPKEITNGLKMIEAQMSSSKTHSTPHHKQKGRWLLIGYRS